MVGTDRLISGVGKRGCTNKTRGTLTDELCDGSLCSPLQFLQFLCHITLQIPTFIDSHDNRLTLSISTYLRTKNILKIVSPVGFPWSQVCQILWERKERRDFNITTTDIMFEWISCLLTTSSIMGSGLAASNWSFTLSSTANKNTLIYTNLFNHNIIYKGKVFTY